MARCASSLEIMFIAIKMHKINTTVHLLYALTGKKKKNPAKIIKQIRKMRNQHLPHGSRSLWLYVLQIAVVIFPSLPGQQHSPGMDMTIALPREVWLL